MIMKSSIGVPREAAVLSCPAIRSAVVGCDAQPRIPGDEFPRALVMSRR
jgi:hypothetical protein